MSVLGPTGMGAWNIASSAAASQRNPAVADRIQADQAQQKLHADQVQLTTREIDDNIDSEFSHGQVGDRDADGREAWEFRERQQQPDDSETAETPPPNKPPADDEDGHVLDLNA